MRPLRERPSAILLSAQVLAMIGLAFVGPAQRPIISLVGLVILTLAIVDGARHVPALTWVSGLIALPALAARAGSYRHPGRYGGLYCRHQPAGDLLFLRRTRLIAYAFDDHWARDELFAVGAAFTVMTWAFAYVYLVVQRSIPAHLRPTKVWGSAPSTN